MTTSHTGQIGRINLEGLTKLPSGVDEFEVTTYQGLFSFSMLVLFHGESFQGKTVFLANDIDYAEMFPAGTDGLGSKNHVPVGTNLRPFCGTFDGGGFAVKIIRFDVAPNEPVGFFGKTVDAHIKNLIVENAGIDAALMIQSHHNNVHFGAIVGHAENTSVINCVNKASIANLRSGAFAGGIVGFGEGFRILNCINFGEVTASTVGLMIASFNSSEEPRMVICCMNFGEIDGDNSFESLLYVPEKVEYGRDMPFNDGYDVAVDVYKLKNWTIADWEMQNKKNFLEEFNIGVRAARIECARAARTSELIYADRFRRHMFYWGLDDDGFPTAHTNMPILGADLLFEYTHIETGAIALFRSYMDCLLYAMGEDALTVAAREDFYKEFSALSQELNDMYMGVKFIIDTETKVTEVKIIKDEGKIDFSRRLAHFSNTVALERFNVIYGAWQDALNQEFVNSLDDFAVRMISSWYHDCLAFISDGDALATETRSKLTTRYNFLIEELAQILFEGDHADYTLKITDFVSFSIDELDDIYFEWDFAVMRAQLDEAFGKAKRTAPARHKNRVQRIYDEAIGGIDVAEASDSRWVDSAAAGWAIQTDALSEFYSLKRKWEKERTTAVWLSVIGGLLLLAGGVVGVLLFVMSKREKQYNAIVFNSTDKRHWKEKRLSQKAEEVSRESEAKRERAEEIAKIQREKALTLAEEKRKMDAEQEKLTRSREEQFAKQVKLVLEEQKKKDSLDQLAKQIKKQEPKEPKSPSKPV